jgi:hypothetical protein
MLNQSVEYHNISPVGDISLIFKEILLQLGAAAISLQLPQAYSSKCNLRVVKDTPMISYTGKSLTFTVHLTLSSSNQNVVCLSSLLLTHMRNLGHFAGHGEGRSMQ